MAEDGKVKLIRRSISDTFEEYRVVQNINGVRASTLDRISYSMNTFTKVFGESFPVETVTESHIDEWKKYWHKEHSPNTVNIDLSKIKAFLNWCYKKGYMPRKLDYVMVVADPKPIAYLSEPNFNDIMQCDIIDVHFRRSFLFYYMTGCRKSEPFNGILAGDYLIIEPSQAKSHTIREIYLNPMLKSILLEMRNRYDMLMTKYNQKARNIIMRYSKEFKKACRSVGIKGRTLHNLRDTYAVRRWAITGDIKLVSDEIGHASVVMTEKYAKCNLRRLQSDFPSIADTIAIRLNRPSEDAYFTDLLNAHI
jgi:integrase